MGVEVKCLQKTEVWFSNIGVFISLYRRAIFLYAHAVFSRMNGLAKISNHMYFFQTYKLFDIIVIHLLFLFL